MIKAITVKTKPFEFNVGDTLYTGYTQFLSTHVVTGAPYKSGPGSGWKLPVTTTLLGTARLNNEVFALPYGHVIEDDVLFLGDLGVPAYAYDGRPCTLARSAEAAVIQDLKYGAWLERRNDLRNRQDIFGYWFY